MKQKGQCFFLLLLIFVFASEYISQEYAEEDETPVAFPAMEDIAENTCTAHDNTRGRCRPARLCVFRFDSVGESEQTSCTMEDGGTGVCCPGKAPPTRSHGPVQPAADDPVFMPDISPVDLDSAGQEGRSIVQRIERLETELRRRGLFAKKDSPEYFQQAMFGEESQKVWRLSQDGLTGVEATLKLVRTFKLSSVQGTEGLRRFSLANTVIRDACPKPPPCAATKYRAYDGGCNNLQHPEWGRALQPYARVLQPRYADGINEPRASYDGGPLPGAREVSHRISPSLDRPNHLVTVLFSLWAQFLAYDLSQTAVTQAGRGEALDCCHEEISKNPRLVHPACLPVHVPDDDRYHKHYGGTCINFVRSVASPRDGCTFGPREQLNQVTAYIDGSMVYGSSENRTKALRSFVGGKLKSSLVGGGEMLPTNAGAPCYSDSKRVECFVSGDSRCNSQVLLSLMQGVWLREHNRLAAGLGRRNPGWSDEIVFREARRIVAALVQHVTYSEFLPLLLGEKVMSSFKLVPKLAGYTFDYDAEVNADIINSFATAANRFGHTLVQDEVVSFSADGRKLAGTLTSAHYFDPSVLYEAGSFDTLARGAARQPAQAFDSYVTHHLTDRLFEAGRRGRGLDLVALNIQRGRDHGLPGYNEWREHCGLPRVRSFEALGAVLEPAAAANFSRLYGSVDDADLYPAGISENPLPDAILGPTFACLVAEQFRRLKHGDRFWYENGGMQSSFTEAQLSEIRKVTLARILCDNSNLESIQMVAFIKPAQRNPTELCRSETIPSLNLDHWKNEPVWT